MLPVTHGAFQVMRSIPGAYSVRNIPIPKQWDSKRRPHVALLHPTSDEMARVVLSEHVGGGKIQSMDTELLPTGSIVEIKQNSSEYNYYRREKIGWMKVADGIDPCFIEAFQGGSEPIEINLCRGNNLYDFAN
ncbi:MAG: hypothetical protein PVG65_05155 [Candidatus Thorarchaeota archaeon]|jgi:hypothetical protein